LPDPKLVRLILNQLDHLPLRFNVGLNVALGCAQSSVSRQHLHVPIASGRVSADAL